MDPQEIAQKEQELNQREATLKAAEETARKAAAVNFTESLVKEGKLLPAQKNAATALLTDLSTETTVDFAEGDATVSKSPAQTFKDLLSAMPKVIDFGEAAGPEHGAPPKQTDDAVDFAEDLTSKV